MNTIFEIKNKSMIPHHLQPLTDSLGLTATGIASYVNFKIAFLGATFTGFLLNPILSTLLTIIISILSILWIIMKIYDQYLTTKLKKEAMAGAQPEKNKEFLKSLKKDE